MNAARLAAAVAAVLTLQGAGIAQVSPLPTCAIIALDIGRGFTLTQYMFDGASEFELTFEPPASAIRTRDVTPSAPFRLVFSQMDLSPRSNWGTPLGSPHLGYSSHEFLTPDGKRIGAGTVRFECGGGQILSGSYHPTAPPTGISRPVFVQTQFVGQGEYRCLSKMHESERFKLTITEHGLTEPAIVIEGELPLQWALGEVERVWRSRLEDAEKGRCRLVPHPPPPF